MDYQKIYENLIDRAKHREVPNDYTEKHHIHPKCMGGSDDKANIAILTAREHFIAHQLLYKIHRTPNLMYAINMMCLNLQGKRINNRRYEWVRREHAKNVSIRMMGENNPKYGIPLSDENKSIISLHHTGKVNSIDTRNKISESLKGKYCGEKGSQFGKSQSSEIIKKRSSKCNKPIVQIDKDTKELIKEFKSIIEASLELNIPKGNIVKVLKGERTHTMGFSWEYVNTVPDELIIQLDKNTEEIMNTFKSVNDAAKHLGYKDGREITRCISGSRNKTFGGYKWKTIKNEETS